MGGHFCLPHIFENIIANNLEYFNSSEVLNIWRICDSIFLYVIDSRRNGNVKFANDINSKRVMLR